MLIIFFVFWFNKGSNFFCCLYKVCIWGVFFLKWVDFRVIVVFIFCNWFNNDWYFGVWFKVEVIKVFLGLIFNWFCNIV